MRTLLLIAAMLMFATAAFAVEPGERLSDKKLEARAHAIGEELRCLVCQNESIEDSNADLAHDLRLIVRKRVLAGDSDAEVKHYLVARYGNYVLLRPPFDSETYLLWLGPFALLLAGAGIAALIFFRNAAPPAPAPALSAEEQRRLAALIGEESKTP